MTTTTKIKRDIASTFSPSVNIIRDTKSQLNYIVTPNSQDVYDQVINDIKIGIRSFNVVGAYGTGKSSFLWAVEREFTNTNKFFSKGNQLVLGVKEFSFLKLVGEYESLIENFATELGITKTNFRIAELIEKLKKFYDALAVKKQGLVIVIDEFGKFLEYASKNNPEKELYFIQRLCEFVNDGSRNIVFISTLHQDFNGYSRDLTKSQQKEWDKVKGRLKEITFNEPVEQLLFLAANRLPQVKKYSRPPSFSKLFGAISNSKCFPLKDYFTETFAERLLPFDILAAAVLTLGLQKYGQNERSLFSFIESNDQFGLKDFEKSGLEYFNISAVYDYMLHNYYSFLTTRYNPHYPQWAAIKNATQRAEGLSDVNSSDAVKIIKSIGLLNIFAYGSAKIDDEFLVSYAKLSLGVSNPASTIKSLVGFKIIRLVKHTKRYIISEGIDFDLDLAIDQAGKIVQRVSSVAHPLSAHFDFPFMLAKSEYFAKGTPRYFSFHISEMPVKLEPFGEIDGFVNLIFSDGDIEAEIVKVSKSCDEAVIYGWYRNTFEIGNLLFEIEKVKKVKEMHFDDRIAVRELNSILQYQIRLLNHYVAGSLFASDSPVTWYSNGEPVVIANQKGFNRLLSRVCSKVYSKTPVFRNEMVNKTRLSGVISTARRSFLTALTTKSHEVELGMDVAKFPPERTIYLSLLRETGIHRETKSGFVIGAPTNEESRFLDLWNHSCDFLRSTKSGKRRVQDLIDSLLSKPFKLKQGLIDFWIPIFLYAQRNEFALFAEGVYAPYLTTEILELICKEPKDYEIKAFDVKGVKLDLFNSYRKLLSQSVQQSPSSITFIETIRPFLTFYSKLPFYTKETTKLSKEARELRTAIAKSKDPEDTFFDHFPRALGFSIAELQRDQKALAKYVVKLEESIKIIRTCFDELLNRVEGFLKTEIIGEELDYPEYKLNLESRFAPVKKHLLSPDQRSLYNRIFAQDMERKDWLNSFAYGCIGKSLENINDQEELILFERIKELIYELDNLCEISKSGFDESKEMVFKLEVTSFVEGLKRNLVRIPISKNKDLIQLESSIKSKFSNDRQLNIATLAKILDELLKNEK